MDPNNGNVRPAAPILAHPFSFPMAAAAAKPPAPPSAAAPAVAMNPHLMINPALFRINPNGPIFTADNPVFFNDRYDGNTRWYFPEFALKLPLLNSFALKCRQSGVDQNAVPRYAGEATLVVSKNLPPAIQALAQAVGCNYREIPLNGLAMAFVVTLFDHSTLPYPAQLAPNGADYTLTIALETQESLNAFYKFISDPANQPVCSLTVTGTYFGYVASVQPPPPNNCQTAFTNSHLQQLQTNRLQAERMQTFGLIARPILAPVAENIVRPNLPAINPAASYDAREALPFARSINPVNFDARNFPNNYLLAGPGGITAFGCKPPFGDAGLKSATYSVFSLNQGDLTSRGYGIKAIYRNTYNSNFLVIPERYVLALDKTEDEQMLAPSAYLFTSIDVNDVNGVNNSSATFEFKLVPAVSASQLLLIKQLILANLPAVLGRTLDNIFIDFPQNVGNSGNLVFDAAHIPVVTVSPMLAYENGVPGSNYFNLQFQNVPIGNGSATWVSMQLKNPAGSVVANLAFAVDADADTSPLAVADLSLSRVAGNGLVFRTDGTTRCLVNQTLYDISVDAWLTADGSVQVLAAPVLVPANGSINADATGVPGDLSLVTWRYAFQPVPAYLNQVLNEMRIVNMDTVTDAIIVTNNTGLFTLFKIANIDFVISIIKPGETDPAKALATATKTLLVDGAINEVPFVLPVAQYLSKWSAVYSTVVNFQDGTQQVNAVQLIDDLNSIGKLINLTVSKLNLQKPAPPSQPPFP